MKKGLLSLLGLAVLMLAPACGCFRKMCAPRCEPCPARTQCYEEKVPVNAYRVRKTCVTDNVGPICYECPPPGPVCPPCPTNGYSPMKRRGPRKRVTERVTRSTVDTSNGGDIIFENGNE